MVPSLPVACSGERLAWGTNTCDIRGSKGNVFPNSQLSNITDKPITHVFSIRESRFGLNTEGGEVGRRVSFAWFPCEVRMANTHVNAGRVIIHSSYTLIGDLFILIQIVSCPRPSFEPSAAKLKNLEVIS